MKKVVIKNISKIVSGDLKKGIALQRANVMKEVAMKILGAFSRENGFDEEPNTSDSEEEG